MSATLEQAIAAFRAGDHAAAESAVRAVLATQESDAAQHLLALAIAGQGRGEEALAIMEALHQRRPDELEVMRNLAITSRRFARPQRAMALFVALGDRGVDAAAHWTQAAEIAVELDQIDAAESLLERVLARKPDHGEALATLAQIAEQRNDDQRAARLAARALEHRPDSFKAAFVLARLDLRGGAYAEARRRLDRLLDEPLAAVNRALVLGRLGELERREGDLQQAFALHRQANALLAASEQAKALIGSSVYGPASIAQLEQFFAADRLRNWRARPPGSAPDEPIFLIGFPRSGTTLLDRMLDAHPELAVIEEKPTLAPWLDRYAQGTAQLQAYEALDERGLAKLAADYHAAVSSFAHAGPQAIDKTPLNIAFLPLIHRVFPRARILFAQRDPRDVCLSCFFQSFGLNEAMSQFLDWNTTARYYAQVMGLGLKSLDSLPIRCLPVRYEQLIETPQAVICEVLEFLDLPWDDQVLNYREKAAQTRINTPSYEQVVQPIYRSSVGNWRHFPQQIAEIEPLLKPFIERLGYPSA